MSYSKQAVLSSASDGLDDDESRNIVAQGSGASDGEHVKDSYADHDRSQSSDPPSRVSSLETIAEYISTIKIQSWRKASRTIGIAHNALVADGAGVTVTASSSSPG